MSEKKLYEMGALRHAGHPHLAVRVMQQTWIMISCSQISGQMSFKLFPNTGWQNHWVETLDNYSENANGISHEAHIRGIAKQIKQETMVEKMAEAVRLLGLGTMYDPFVSIEQRLPMVTDGKKALEVIWPGDKTPTSVKFFEPKEPHKCYRLLNDPCSLAHNGDVLMPLQAVLKRIDEEFVQFADPFSTKNTGHNNPNEVKTIGAIDRIQRRRRSISKK